MKFLSFEEINNFRGKPVNNETLDLIRVSVVYNVVKESKIRNTIYCRVDGLCNRKYCPLNESMLCLNFNNFLEIQLVFKRMEKEYIKKNCIQLELFEI